MADLVKWDPFQDMTRFFEEVDKLFEHFLKSFSQELYATQLAGTKMNLQVKDNGNEVIITGDVPNIAKDNVDVILRSDHVIVSGETLSNTDKEGGKQVHWSKFTRACTLPVKVKSEGAKVNLENGKLIIRAIKQGS